MRLSSPRPAEPPSSRNGLIPLRIRIGVAGHRTLDDEPAIASVIDAWLDHIASCCPITRSTDVAVTVVSSLAEGADRLLTTHALERFASAQVDIEAVLPRPPGEYEKDFVDQASVEEFRRLMKRARQTTVVEPTSDLSEGYARAGKGVVDVSDVLVVIWDGEPARGPGGTGEVVAYARTVGLPVVVIDSLAPAPPEAAAMDVTDITLNSSDRLERLEGYNAVSRSSLTDRTTQARRSLAKDLGSQIPEWAHDVSEWALPLLTRADDLAQRFQRWYLLTGSILFASAAVAAATEAAQVVFGLKSQWWSAVELGLMVLILFGVLTGRRLSLHDQWVEYRSLAEALRGAMFVAMAGVREADTRVRPVSDRSSRWHERAFAEAWRQRPRVQHHEHDVRELAHVIERAWLAKQVTYHQQASAHRQSRYELMTMGVVILFGLALAIAAVHVVAGGRLPSSLEQVTTFLAIALPGFGAALTGIRNQRQYRTHAERSIRIAERLVLYQSAFEQELTLDDLQRLAREIQSLLADEAGEWSDTLELENLEIAL